MAILSKNKAEKVTQPSLSLVLVFAHLFHPINDLAVQLFLCGNVCHCDCWRRAMPMFFSRRKPYHITRANFFNRASLLLYPSEAGGHNQRLTEGMRVPRSSCAG